MKEKKSGFESRRKLDIGPAFHPERNVLMALSVYNSDIHRGVARFGRDHNWHITADFEDEIPAFWQGHGVLTQLGAPEKIWQHLQHLEVPIVDLAESRPNIRIPRVTVDNAAIGEIAAEFFLSRGFRKFAFVHRWDLGTSRKRRDHFLSRIEKEGFDCEVFCWENDRGRLKDTSDQRRLWMKRWLGQLETPFAIFSSRDVEASMVIECSLELGLRVPDQVSVLGVGNSEAICECSRVPLSSIEDNWELVGYEGAALLNSLMNGQPAPDQPILIRPGGIVQRQSTDSLAVDHPEVVTALRFIHDHFNRSINMTDVIKAVGLSRSGLEKAFRENYVRPPMEELRHVRLEKAKAMLINTDEKIKIIAQNTGHQTLHNLCRTLKRQTGLTPKQFRQQHRY